MNMLRTCLAAAMLLPAMTAAAPQIVAAAVPPTDLREFRVGMAVSELPESGYGAFACVDDPSAKLADWRDYKACPAASDGLRAISFRYGDDDDGSKTLVGGQPVNLALLIDDSARVHGLHIETDPRTRLYLHKKAYLFALQVRARFGEDGWTCQKAEPTQSEQPVGGVFYKEHCEKTTATRHFLLDRQLYRDPTKDLRDFTDATQLTILLPG
jgi:hypothetical protein